MNPFQVGQWIQWSTHDRVRRGEVILSKGPSIIVRWLDGEEQVFPLTEHLTGALDFVEASMVVIQRPKEASRIEREARKGVMSIARAASTLGTTPKRVRAMLRGGQLNGIQRNGKWVSVEL